MSLSHSVRIIGPTLLREAFGALLTRLPGLVVWKVENGVPDVILGINVDPTPLNVSDIIKQHPSARVLLFTPGWTAEAALCAVQEGANGDLSQASLEFREALAPAIELTDTVLVPVAPTPQQFTDYQAPSGIRNWLAHRFDSLLRWGQQRANGPEAVHGMAFETFCHTVCAMEEMTWKRTDRWAYQDRTRALAENILSAIQRDPSGRVLVVVQCQWHHALEPLLKKEPGNWVELVDYQEL